MLAAISLNFNAATAAAALPKVLGGTGIGISGQKANLDGKYPTFWDNLMEQQSYSDMRRGLLEMQASKYDEAAQSFAKAVVKNPNEPYPHVFLGVALYWQGRVDPAMAEYRAALKLNPDNAEAHQLLGIAYAWKGQLKDALEEFKTTVKLAPNRSDAHMNLGSTYAASGNLDDALFHFRKAVELDPNHPLYQYQLASLLEVLGRDGQAEEHFKRALRQYPYYEEAMLALGALYEKMSKNTNAEIYYKKALKLKPGDSVARVRLANLLARENRKDEAVEVMSRAFVISPLSGEGLALSIAYGGKGASSAAGSGPGSGGQSSGLDKQLQQFKNKLAQIPADKQVNIDAELLFEPKPAPPKADVIKISGEGGKPATKPIPQGGTQLGAAIQQAMQTTFSRTFILMPSTQEARREQLDKIFEALDNVLKESSKTNNIKMSLRGATPVRDTTTLSGEMANPNLSNSNARAGYNPYMVGNDMGLWVAGKGWVKYIQDILPEAQGRLSGGDSRDYIISGAAAMVLGDGANALTDYAKALDLATANNVKEIGSLGIATAYVILGDEDSALSEYKKVLEINPKNEIAANNIAVLSFKEEVK